MCHMSSYSDSHEQAARELYEDDADLSPFWTRLAIEEGAARDRSDDEQEALEDAWILRGQREDAEL